METHVIRYGMSNLVDKVEEAARLIPGCDFLFIMDSFSKDGVLERTRIFERYKQVRVTLVYDADMDGEPFNRD